IELAALSPNTDSTPALNEAVVAAFAAGLAAKAAATPTTIPASSPCRRLTRRPLSLLPSIVSTPRGVVGLVRALPFAPKDATKAPTIPVVARVTLLRAGRGVEADGGGPRGSARPRQRAELRDRPAGRREVDEPRGAPARGRSRRAAVHLGRRAGGHP